MLFFSTLNVGAALGVVALYVVVRYLLAKRHKLPLPPGPKGLPILGNIKDMPKANELEWIHWLKHKDIYGPISSVSVLGQTFVIVNDADIALKLLKDRAPNYSGRPKQVLAGEMVGWNKMLAFLQPGWDFRQHRRNIAKIAGSTTSLAAFDRIQNEEAAHFLLNMLNNPDHLFDHLKTEAGAVILRITYGYTPNAQGPDPLVDMAERSMRDFGNAGTPGKYVVDLLPFLRYLPDWCPGTGFKTMARDMRTNFIRSAEQPYSWVKEQMRNKKAKTSFLSQAIESLGTETSMEEVHRWSSVSMYFGGSDTTVSSLMTFFLVMALYPDVQKKAQEELDRVIGGDRLPLTSDKANLPYIEAIVKETHRWHPVAPMAVPHCPLEEDSIDGYRIPKGALVMTNVWWFTHDPAIYPDPMAFQPERFIQTPTHTPEPDPRLWTFGYGRRICPGRYIADNALFTTIAQSLAVFNIEKPVENGKTVEPKVGFEPGVVSHPCKLEKDNSEKLYYCITLY
jgi:cytochrome P450